MIDESDLNSKQEYISKQLTQWFDFQKTPQIAFDLYQYDRDVKAIRTADSHDPNRIIIHYIDHAHRELTFVYTQFMRIGETPSNVPYTYRRLAGEIAKMSEEQKDTTVTILDVSQEEYFQVTGVEESEEADILDAFHPYLLTDGNVKSLNIED